MQPGAITEHIDVAQVAFWVFFLVFLGIVFYLRRQDKTEGYPLRDPVGNASLGYPRPPPPQTYIRFDGSTTSAPHRDPDPPFYARPSAGFPGAPSVPIGYKLTAALGPGTYAMRRDEPFRTTDGRPQVVPLRIATEWSVAVGDADPRGMIVLDVESLPVGRVRDIWVDRGVKILRYLEVDLDRMFSGRTILLPIYFCDIDERARTIRVTALHQTQFSSVPRPKHPDEISAREEDMVNAHYAGGRFYINEPAGNMPL